MRNILILLTLCLSIKSFAQTREVQRIVPQSVAHISYDYQNGDYIKDTENKLDQYVGTWEYNDGSGNVFTLKLQRVNQFLNDLGGNRYSFSDEIIISYKLIKDNILIINKLNDIIPLEVPSSDDLLGFGFVNNFHSYDNLEGFFGDETYNIIANCEIIKLYTPLGQPEKIMFKLTKPFKRNDTSFYQGLSETYSVPNNVELTKL